MEQEMQDYIEVLGLIVYEDAIVEDEDMEGEWEDVGEL